MKKGLVMIADMGAPPLQESHEGDPNRVLGFLTGWLLMNIWYWIRSVALMSFVLVISSGIGFSNAPAQRMRPSKVVTYFPQAHGARAHGMSIQADGKIVVVGA